MTPEDLGLPYKSWHPGQWETITALACSDKRIVFLEAPTGSGKSGIVKALSRLLGLKMIALTGTLQLQDQYEQSLGIPTARGRANFACQLEPWNHAGAAVCTVGASCPHKTYTRHLFYPPEDHKTGCVPCDDARDVPCQYYWQSYAAERAPEVVLNYAYWLSLANFTGRFREPGLLVLDEAHTLDDHIRSFATVRISRRAVNRLGLPVPYMGVTDVKGWFEWGESIRDRLDREYRGILSGRLGPPTDPADTSRRGDVLTICRALDMLLCQPPESWIGERDEKTGTTTFKPIWVSGLTRLLVTRHIGERAIFMSGTILDAEFFAENLGIPLSEVDFIRVNSTFPAANRPVHYEPIGKVNTRDDDKLGEVVARIDQIIDRHPGKKGIIHTVSHKLAGVIIRESKHTRRMIGHVRENKAAQLDLYKKSPDGIWVSPSSGTGVDLPYDDCRWQIVAKLPFPDMGDKQIRQAMKEGPDGVPLPSATRWYNWATACTFMQMVGRGMRAPDDSCVTYLIDGNWGWFRHYFNSVAPGWFLKAWRRPRFFVEEEIKENDDQWLARMLAG